VLEPSVVHDALLLRTSWATCLDFAFPGHFSMDCVATVRPHLSYKGAFSDATLPTRASSVLAPPLPLPIYPSKRGLLTTGAFASATG
jgi:hypothetical protein